MTPKEIELLMRFSEFGDEMAYGVSFATRGHADAELHGIAKRHFGAAARLLVDAIEISQELAASRKDRES